MNKTGGGAHAASTARELVDSLGSGNALSRTIAAERFELIDQLRVTVEGETGASWTAPDDLAWRDLRVEVAAVLTIHERSAQAQLDLARRLVQDFSNTLAGLRSGAVSERNVQVLVDESAGLSPDLLSAYEQRLLPAAAELFGSRFQKLAREVRAALRPEAMIERHREALLTRRVAVEAAPDGMAWYGALLSAEDAVGASSSVTGIARGLMVEGETRTLAQVEADVFRDLILDVFGVVPTAEAGTAPAASPAARRGVRAEVLIHVPVLTAIGRSDDGGLLDGYGPIDAETARQLCADAPGFVRVLTDPEDGAVMSFGRTTYRVPAELKRFLRVGDEVCRFVGCFRSAALCDIDHTIPWEEHGQTVEENLAHLCRGHHRLKERRRWRIGHDPGGIIRWTSPTGRTYETKPARRGFPRVGAPPKPMVEWLVRDTGMDPPSDGTPPFWPRPPGFTHDTTSQEGTHDHASHRRPAGRFRSGRAHAR